MMSNLDRYKKDLESLIGTGEQLAYSIQAERYPEEFESEVKKKLGPSTKKFLTGLPPFARTYQRWYSEAQALIRQLLPDRLTDFIQHYRAACETPGAFGLAQSSILLVNTHSPWIADWMPALEDRRHAERWK